MKSKKIVALALTAAMAISMASMTAFAKTEYKDGGTSGDITTATAVVTLTADEYAAIKDGEGKVTIAALADYGLDLKYTGFNTGTKTLVAWSTAGGKKASADAATPTDTLVTPAADGDNYKVELKPEYTETADDEQIAKNLKAIEDAKKDEEKTKSRDEKLKEGDKANSATDNVKTADGPATKAAPVDGPQELTDDTKHDFNVANIFDDKKNLAWVYYVNETDPITVLSGKNARVTLKAPKGYDPTNYKVTVYHIKGYCSAERVKGLDIASSDVTFWANDFSPYVLVLTPKDAVAGTSTGNPSTGDFSAVPVAMLAAAALGATGFVAYKKRKAE